MFTKNQLLIILFVLLGSALYGQRINVTECGATFTYTCTGGASTSISANYTNTWNLSGVGDYTVNIPTGAGWYYTVLGDGYGVTGTFTNYGQTGTFYFTISEALLAPENLRFVFSDNIYLVWDAVPTATSYNVYSSDDPYSTFSLAETVTTNLWSPSSSEAKKFYYVTSVRE